MPAFLPNSFCAANLHTFSRHSCCGDLFESLGLDCREKPVAGSSKLNAFTHRSPRRSGFLSRKKFAKLSKRAPFLSHTTRQTEVQSSPCLHSLVLEEKRNDTVAISNDFRKVEVVGEDIDLSHAMELLRKKGLISPGQSRKQLVHHVNLEANPVLEPSRESDAANEAELRSEGDAPDLAEIDPPGMNDMEPMWKSSRLKIVDGSYRSEVNGIQFPYAGESGESTTVVGQAVRSTVEKKDDTRAIDLLWQPIIGDKPADEDHKVVQTDVLSWASKSIADDKDDHEVPNTLQRPIAVGKFLAEDHEVVPQLDLKKGLKDLLDLIGSQCYVAAKHLAEQLYELYPENTDVLVEYAYVERQCGNLGKAASLYSQAIRVFEKEGNLGYGYIRALQSLGSVEARAGNWQKARMFFMDSISAARQEQHRSPGTIDGAGVYGLHAWAKMEEKLGNWSKAQELLAKAAEIQPGNAVVHQYRALLEAKAHNWNAARYHFRLATTVAPNDVKCWQAWAIFEAEQYNRARMRQLFKKALQIDLKNIHSLQAWAYQEALIGTPESKERARSLFQRSTELDPRNLFSWQAWAVMEQSSDNYEKARVLFEKCLQLDASSVVSLQAFAKMERDLGNLIAAQELLRRALRLEPRNAAVLMECALVEEALGNVHASEELFKRAGMEDRRRHRHRRQTFLSRNAAYPELQKIYMKGKLVRRGALERKAPVRRWHRKGRLENRTESGLQMASTGLELGEIR